MSLLKNKNGVSLLLNKENPIKRVLALTLSLTMLWMSVPISPLFAFDPLGSSGGAQRTMTPEEAAMLERQSRPVPKETDPDAPLSPASDSTPENYETAEQFAQDVDTIRSEYAAAFVTGKLTRTQFDALISQSVNEKVEVAAMVSDKGYSMVASSGSDNSVMSTVGNLSVFKSNTFTLHSHIDAVAVPSIEDINFYKLNRSARLAAGITATLYQYLVDKQGNAYRYYLSSSDKLYITQISRTTLYGAYANAVKIPTNQAEVAARAALNQFVAAEQNKLNNRVKWGNEIVDFLADGPTNVTQIISADILTRLGFTAAQQQNNAYVNTQFATALGIPNPSTATFNQIVAGLQQQHEVVFPNGVSLVGAAATLTPTVAEPELLGDELPVGLYDFPQADTLSFQLVREFAGWKTQTIFGIYFVNPDNSIVKQPIFNGSATPGSKLDFNIPAGSRVGFYIQTPIGDTWYSETSRNVDSGKHFKRFESDPSVGISSFGIEDLPIAGSAYYLANKQKYDTFTGGPHIPDTDYQDLYITVLAANKNEPPVPTNTPQVTPEDTPKTFTIATDPNNDQLTVHVTTPPQHGDVFCDASVAGVVTCEYIPNENYNGPDSFDFTVIDEQGEQASATQLITVTPVNDPPVAFNKSVQTNKNTSVQVQLQGNDPVEGTPVTYFIDAQPLHGTLTQCNFSTGVCTYTPNSGYFGSDVFTYHVTDTDSNPLNSNIATVTIQIFDTVNLPPVANPQSVTTPEDTPKQITLTGSDPDGNPITYTILTQPLHGTLVCNVLPNCTYTPNSNYNGPDSFTFKTNDGTVDSPSAVVTIDVTPVNDPPAANPQTVTTPEDTPKQITLTGSDPDGNPITYTILTQPLHGTLVCNVLPNCTYTPNANYNGPDSFTFKTNDGIADSPSALVTINVTPVNDPPAANPQTVTTPEDTPKQITLTGSDPDGNPITFKDVTQPSHGTVNCNLATGVCTYTPDANYNGPDSFTFKTNDGLVDSPVAIVTINVTPVNDAPTANPQTVTTPEDTPKNITLTGGDPDGNPITYIIVTPPSHGTIICTGANCVYTPDPNYNGPDSFTFKTNDGLVDSPVATVTINVTPVNDPPAAQPVVKTTPEDTPITFSLVGTDPEGNSLTYQLTGTIPTGLVCNASGSCTYTPPANFTGTVNATYTVTDSGNLVSNIAPITINVTPVNDPPVAQDVNKTTNKNTPITFNLIGNDPVEGDPLTYVKLTNPSSGTVTCNASTGVCTYTPNSNFVGIDSFTYRVTDPALSNVATVTIQVLETNLPPTGDNTQLVTPEDTPITKKVFTDPNGDPLVITVVTPPAHGTVTCDSTGTCVYTPNPNYNGPDSFTVTGKDPSNAQVTVTVPVTVTPVNDPPVAVDKIAQTNKNTPVQIQLQGSDPIEGTAVTYTLATQPAHGTVACSATTGLCTYTPTNGYVGNDVFTYYVTDTDADPKNSNIATVQISILQTPNQPPVAQDKNVTTPEDTPITFQLVATDPNGDPLEYHLDPTTIPAGTNLTCTLAGLCTYIPPANFNGTITGIKYFVGDAEAVAYANITINVTPVNDPPAVPTEPSLWESRFMDPSISPGHLPLGWVAIMLGDALDVDGQQLKYTVDPVLISGTGRLEQNPFNSLWLDYVPTVSSTHMYEVVFKYYVSDGTNTVQAFGKILVITTEAALREQIALTYNDLLGRAPSAAEVTNHVNSGLSLLGIRNDVTRTNEFYVRNSFAGMLGRYPSASELSQWMGGFQTDGMWWHLQDAIAKSPEYLGRRANNADFLQALYWDLLNRDANDAPPLNLQTSPDRLYYDVLLNKLNNGTLTRLQAVNLFLASSEYREDIGRRLGLYYGVQFYNGAHRSNNWPPNYVTAPPQASIVPAPTAASIKALYNELLRRDPTTAETSSWLSSNATYASILTQVDASNEAYVVRKYGLLLNRVPTAAERSSGITLLNGGTARVELMKNIVRSTEYRNRLNGNGAAMSQDEFMKFLFRDLYFYGNTEALYSNWLTKLKRGTMSRLQVINALLGTSIFSVIVNSGHFNY